MLKEMIVVLCARERGIVESCGFKIFAVLGVGGVWCSIDPHKPHGVGLWKNIRRG